MVSGLAYAALRRPGRGKAPTAPGISVEVVDHGVRLLMPSSWDLIFRGVGDSKSDWRLELAITNLPIVRSSPKAQTCGLGC